MKKNLLLLIIIAACQQLPAQVIKEIQAYNANDGVRFISRLADNTLWWYADGKQWQKIPMTGLPQNVPLTMMDAYVKGALSKSTRLVAVLSDNSIWWYSDGSAWEKVPVAGLPVKTAIKIFKPYIKYGMMGSADTRFVTVLEDNSVYWYNKSDAWQKVENSGLPANAAIRFLSTYQKIGMGGAETRYIAVLTDNSIWWYVDGKPWQLLKTSGLPKDAQLAQFEAYMKSTMGMGDGRLLTVLNDQSIWWFAVSGKEWTSLESAGLPAGYKVRSLKVYQKSPGFTGDTRVILLLEDNTIWWYAEKKGWQQLTRDGLPK